MNNTTLKGSINMEETENKVIDYKTLTITLENGNQIIFSEGEWFDYRYTGKAVAVIDENGVWKAIYKFDDIFSVKLS